MVRIRDLSSGDLALFKSLFSELDFALFHQIFYFEHSILDSVASVRKIPFVNLFVDPSNEFWQNAHGKLDFDHSNPVASYKLCGA